MAWGTSGRVYNLEHKVEHLAAKVQYCEEQILRLTNLGETLAGGIDALKRILETSNVMSQKAVQVADSFAAKVKHMERRVDDSHGMLEGDDKRLAKLEKQIGIVDNARALLQDRFEKEVSGKLRSQFADFLRQDSQDQEDDDDDY